MIKAAIIGSTGYVGQEIVRLLLKHPFVEIVSLSSRTYINNKYSSIYHNYRDILNVYCTEERIEEIADIADVIFLALPHGIASKKINSDILKKVKIIDLGADFRLKEISTYEQWYKTKHFGKKINSEAVYGLSEWNREKIYKTSLVANPGCYTTCSLLSLSPLIKENLINKDNIIIDAKSGVTGAGRNINLATHFTECNESIKAYNVTTHRHTPEIEQHLSEIALDQIRVNFTPHLVPMNRGILTTSYVKPNVTLTHNEILEVYKKYYDNEFFIRVLPEEVFPETKWVKGSNFCDIGFKIDQRTNSIIIIAAIDNLMKGAAGQAIQNMNILFGFNENIGIDDIPLFPI